MKLNYKKVTLFAAAFMAAASLSSGITAYAAVKRPSNTAVQSNRIPDKDENHLNTIADLIRGLPDQYKDFTSFDHRSFSQAKELMDELNRDMMFRLLDSHADAFDKYSQLCGQEKLDNASK